MLWKRKVLGASLAAFFVLLAAQGAFAAPQLDSTAAGLLRSANAARAANGLGPLRLDATLARAAESHSADMLRREYFAHGSFAQRLVSFGARGPVIGENLAWGDGPYAAPAEVIREWLLSPEHRRNLLRPGFNRIGIGIARGTFLGHGGTTVFTADFAGS